jgi:hypothetical protein
MGNDVADQKYTISQNDKNIYIFNFTPKTKKDDIMVGKTRS